MLAKYWPFSHTQTKGGSMGNILRQRLELGECTEAEDALVSSAFHGSPAEAANVVSAMVNQLGKDEKTITLEEARLTRQAAIFELAGRLSVLPALQELYERPTVPDGGRGVLKPSRHGEEVDRAQLAIVEFLDQRSIQ